MNHFKKRMSRLEARLAEVVGHRPSSLETELLRLQREDPECQRIEREGWSIIVEATKNRADQKELLKDSTEALKVLDFETLVKLHECAARLQVRVEVLRVQQRAALSELGAGFSARREAASTADNPS